MPLHETSSPREGTYCTIVDGNNRTRADKRSPLAGPFTPLSLPTPFQHFKFSFCHSPNVLHILYKLFTLHQADRELTSKPPSAQYILSRVRIQAKARSCRSTGVLDCEETVYTWEWCVTTFITINLYCNYITYSLFVAQRMNTSYPGINRTI